MKFFVLFVSFACGTLLFSASAPKSGTINGSALTTASVMFGFSNYRYVEPGLMSIKTPLLLSIDGSIRTLFPNGLLIGASGSHSRSMLSKYDGSSQDVITRKVTPLSADSNDSITSSDVKVGVRIKISPNVSSYMSVGIGYRVLKNDVSARGAYSRTQGYVYIPTEYDIDYSFKDGSLLFAKIAYKNMLHGWNVSGTVKLGRDNDLIFGEQYGIGFSGDLGYAMRLSNGSRNFGFLVVSLYFETWDISDSNLQALYVRGRFESYMVEPYNVTRNYGVRVGYMF